MSDALPGPSSSAPTPTPDRKARFRRAAGRWQLGLRGLILLVVAAALMSSVSADRRRIAEVSARIDRMRPMLPELEVADPARFAGLELDSPWSDEMTWDVYLPPGRRYQLKLATRAIADGNSPPTLGSAPLAPGRHRLNLTAKVLNKTHVFTARDGDSPLFEVEEPPGWVADTSSWQSHSIGSKGTAQQSIDKPLELVRRRYMRPILNPDGSPTGSSQTPKEPCEGILVWVEALPDADPAPPTPAPPGR